MANRKGSFVAVYALVAVAIIVLSAYYFLKPSGPAITDNSIKKFASYAELEKFIRDNSIGYGGPTLAVSGAMRQASAPAVAESKAQAVDYSRTNIQVEGVDEADIVKSDGKYIYTVTGGNRKVAIVDAYPAETATNISELDFDGEVNGLFVSGNRLVVFWQETMRIPPSAEIPPSEIPSTVGVSEKIMVPQYYQYSQKTHIDVYDISDRKVPVLTSNISVDGDYLESRMIGDYVYFIATQPVYYINDKLSVPKMATNGTFPEIYYFDVPDRSYSFTTIASLNVNKAMEPSSKIILTGATQNLYASAGNIYLTYSKYTDIYMTDKFVDKVILPILPPSLQAEVKVILANSSTGRMEKWGEIQKVLENFSEGLSPEESERLKSLAQSRMAELERELAKEREKTIIQKLSISDGKVEYKTNGEVPGTILNQFSMDEHNGYFRIATTTSGLGWWGGVTAQTRIIEESRAQTSPVVKEAEVPLEETRVKEALRAERPSGPSNNVYALDENLKIVGKLEDLAPGERIYSVRFLGDKGYMVTFRQVDPLFVIDLSQPAEPKVLGFLKIPGVSDYLHPYDETHLIGVGRDATEEGRITGMKLSFFDVANVSSPKEISKYAIGQRGTNSEALRDHKAFLFDRQKSLLVIPVTEYRAGPIIGVPERYWSSYWQGAYIFTLDLTNGFVLKGKVSHFNETEQMWDATVRRSLYIDDVLYTLSNKKVKMNRLADLSEVSEVRLPYETPIYTIEETIPLGTAVR